MKLGMHMIRS